MGALMNWPLALLALCAAPLGLLGSLGLVVLALKVFAVINKAAEPPTQDQSGDYRLEQGHEVK